MANKPPYKVFCGRESEYIARKIVDHMGVELGKTTFLNFSDGEFQPSFEETVRGAHVFIIQSTFQPSDNLMELLLMIDAAVRASAYKVAAVIPYFGMARQDRKDKPRVSIGAKLVANLLSAAGVSRVMTLDLHADQIQGFFDVPVDHLYASTVFVPYIRSLKLDNLVVAAPDMGGTKRANTYSKVLNTEMVICYKQRKKANVVDRMTVIGDVKDRNVIIIDDMVDTAGTITTAANMMMEEGARSVRVVATHGVLSGPAYDRVNASAISELIVTDSIPIDTSRSDKIRVISVAGLFAKVIKNVYNQESISSNFVL